MNRKTHSPGEFQEAEDEPRVHGDPFGHDYRRPTTHACSYSSYGDGPCLCQEGKGRGAAYGIRGAVSQPTYSSSSN